MPNDGQPPETSFEKALWGLRVLYISIGLSLVSTVFTAISNAIEEINALLGWPNKGIISYVNFIVMICSLNLSLSFVSAVATQSKVCLFLFVSSLL